MNAGDISPTDIGVVVVTYQPRGDVEARLQKMSSQGGALVIIDNGSRAADRVLLEPASLAHGWELIKNADNLGLGAALNQGVRRLAGLGFRWALLFDQDSLPATDMSERMIEALQRHAEPTRVAVIGPRFEDVSTGRPHRVLMQHPRCPGLFRKVEIGREDIPDVSMVITSGSLVRVADFETLGGFDEKFFIDYIDTDFCLRCRKLGRLIAVSATARLDHSLGDREKRRWLGIEIEPTNHSPLRHYYIARNRIPMIARHAWREPHWFWFDCAAAGLWIFRVLAAEGQKGRKLLAMVLGTWDGLLGRSGPCPERRQRMLGTGAADAKIRNPVGTV